ncbi:SAM-dependent methyltransferase [Actinomadura meridiana]|uniref:SAM-dependent methyltransferase n=1 Tax=Actinomadura meridiana TaxID=559626 RepID=A0ABP8CPY1_9ACTN
MTPLGLDYSSASRARVYAYLLGSRDCGEVDRKTAEAIIAASPDAPTVAKENLLFAGRAAQWAVEQFGIRQVFDLGVGIVDDVPLPSVETCVHQADPNATVVAVDNDEVVLAHARALRRGYQEVLKGDVTDLDGIFDRPELVGRVDLAVPTLIVLAAVLHFVDDPVAVMAGLRERLAPGSVVIVSHATKTRTSADRVHGMTKAYERGSSSITFRDEEEIGALAEGWTLVDPPGLVDVQLWSADGTYRRASYETVRVVGMALVLPQPTAMEEPHAQTR